jgi:hypothetical protein
MIAVLGWLSLMVPVIVVIFQELAALLRQRGRRGNIERIIESTRSENSVRIVDVDRDGATIRITVERSRQ